jgi:transcriptional regulator with XRE-family HTH domain
MGRKAVTDRQRAEGRRLAERLKAARVKAGREQPELARATGVPLDTLRALEAGRSASPSFFTVARLAHELDVGLDVLALHAMQRRPGQR